MSDPIDGNFQREKSPTLSDNSSATCFDSTCDSAAESLSDDHHQHIVQFYDTQDYLLNIILNFVVPILKAGDAAVIIATRPRLLGLERRLFSRGVSVEDVKKRCQLLLLEANEIVEQISPPDADATLSLDIIQSILTETRSKFPKIYVYGELVNILCSQGNHGAALRLEELWHELMEQHPFTLLCGYDMNNFKEQHLEATFREICSAHSQVNACEDRFTLPSEQATLIALLKQKAMALETEIARRKSVENALQQYLEVLSTRAEESLRQQEESYHTLLSVLPVGVYSADVTLGGDGVFVNDRFCEISGRSEDVIRKEGWFRTVHVDDRERIRHLWDISGGNEGSHPFDGAFGGQEEYRYVHRDGSIRWVKGETVQFQTSPNGAPHTYVHTIVDITRLKEVERQREVARAKAESLLRHRAELAERHKKDLNRFVDTLCHELKNPLGAISGNVELLQIGVGIRGAILKTGSTFDGLDLKRLRDQVQLDQESISAIEKCVAHQKIITDDVLSLSKLEVGKVTLHPVEFNPKATIHDVTRIFEAEANRKNIELRVNVPTSDIIVNGDPDRVSQVLINVLTNALKFTVQGSITLELGFLDDNKNRFTTKISVTDTGIGLTDEEQAKLFQRFMQPASTSYHTSSEGSGLGLFISKGLVELMGGIISVKSTKGLGSKFSFSFLSEKVEAPMSSTAGASPIIPSISPRGRIKEILIVEDNFINQRYLSRLLETGGLSCSTASNGVEALDLLDRKRFDVILMDVHMPIMDGMACTREIRSREAKGHLSFIPIVGLSGNAREEHRVEAISCGMNAYLMKPCKKEDLYAAIAQFEDATI